VELAILRDRGDVEVGVGDHGVPVALHVRAGDGTLARAPDAAVDLVLPLELHAQLLEVQDDVGDVLVDPLERVELVRRALDLHGGDRGALDRGEQHAPQAVADRVPEAALERLDDEPAVRAGQALRVGQDLAG
jgi:hypothetical protein